MKKCFLLLAVFIVIFFSCEQDVVNDTYTVKVEFNGKTGLSPNYVYVCWLEDASGKNIQNLYVCNKALPPDTIHLLGHGLPVWSRPDDGAYYDHTDIDGV